MLRPGVGRRPLSNWTPEARSLMPSSDGPIVWTMSAVGSKTKCRRSTRHTHWRGVPSFLMKLIAGDAPWLLGNIHIYRREYDQPRLICAGQSRLTRTMSRLAGFMAST